MITPAAIRKGQIHDMLFFSLPILDCNSFTSLEKVVASNASAPSRASAKNGSRKASFSSACICAGVSSPRLYFSISVFQSRILLHAYF